MSLSPTVLYSSCWLGGGRLARHLRYLEYYRALKIELAFDSFMFCDNGSDEQERQKLASSDVSFLTYPLHLPTGKGLDYPYCWQAIYAMDHAILRGFKKIIFCDTDFFVLSVRLATFVRELKSGWVSGFCPRHNFPESSFHVLCQDAFPIFQHYCSEMPWPARNGRLMEMDLPFTDVRKEFKMDRFGEELRQQEPNMDAYGQAQLDIPLTFDLK